MKFFIMKNEILKNALKVEQLEDRFETTVAALDGSRCTANDNEVDVAPSIAAGDGGNEQ